MLDQFEMTMAEFIDLCIMCGCDYTKTIGGVGPVRAFNLIKEHSTIEKVLEKLEQDAESGKKSKYVIPADFKYKESRELFVNPEVISDKAELEALLKWNKPDEEGLKAFLVNEKGFTEQKVESGLAKLAKA